jgi:hypothetical protein
MKASKHRESRDLFRLSVCIEERLSVHELANPVAAGAMASCSHPRRR